MNIPDEAVRAAAIAHHGSAEIARPWSGLAPIVRRIRLKKMRAALEAAAPHMFAGLAESRVAEDGAELFRFTSTQREWLRGGGE